MTIAQDRLAAGWTKTGDPENPDWIPPALPQVPAPFAALTAAELPQYGTYQYLGDGGSTDLPRWTPNLQINVAGKVLDLPQAVNPGLTGADLSAYSIPYTTDSHGLLLVDPANANYRALQAEIGARQSGFDKALSIALPGVVTALAGWGVFSAVSEFAGAASALDVPGVGSGVNLGGLDGALGDSAANYAAGMGANNILAAPAFSVLDVPAPSISAPADAGVNPGGLDGALGDSATNYASGMGVNNILTGAADFGTAGLLSDAASGLKAAASGVFKAVFPSAAAAGVAKLFQPSSSNAALPASGVRLTAAGTTPVMGLIIGGLLLAGAALVVKKYW